MEDKIVTIGNKKDEKFLRAKTKLFDFGKFSRKEINDFIARMKKAMKLANGVGLSANQIGLDFSVFVAQEPPSGDKGKYDAGKFYAVFNPEVLEMTESKEPFEEGCLSVPNVWGEVRPAEKLTLAGYDKNGKKIKIKARGFLAEVFRHETDNLKGKLFIDRAKKLYKVPVSERLRQKQES